MTAVTVLIGISPPAYSERIFDLIGGETVALAPMKRGIPVVLRDMSARGVRRGKAALSSGCKSHPATAPAGSNRSSHGGDEVAEAFG